LEPLPFLARVDEKLRRNRERAEIPGKRAPLEGFLRGLDHRDQIEVAAHSGVAAGVGAEVAEAEEARMAG
jgi:hypothetical protein